VQDTKNGNGVAIDKVKYPVGESLRKCSAYVVVYLLMDVRIFLNAEERSLYCAEKLIAQPRVLVLVPPICRRVIELRFGTDEKTIGFHGRDLIRAITSCQGEPAPGF